MLPWHATHYCCKSWVRNSNQQSSHLNPFPLLLCLQDTTEQILPKQGVGQDKAQSFIHKCLQVVVPGCRALTQPRFVWMLLLHRINLHAASPSASPYASQQSWGRITRAFIDMAQSKLYTTLIFCISSPKAYVALSNSLTRHWMIHNLSVITRIL